MKSILTIEITHDKPLSKIPDFAELCGQRVYGLAYARGVEIGVNTDLQALEDVDTEKQDN